MLRSIFACLSVFAILLFAKPAVADLVLDIPTYKYFYTCDSGVENCATSGFANNFNGNFGLNGLLPTGFSNIPRFTDGSFSVTSSNALGQAVGVIRAAVNGGLGFWVGYGFEGKVYCAFDCLSTDSGNPSVIINDNGVYVAQYPCCVQGSGLFVGADIPSTFSQLQIASVGPYEELDLCQFFSEPCPYIQRTVGINDYNQILIAYDGPDGPSEGILSPIAVPEPSRFALVAVALCGLRMPGNS